MSDRIQVPLELDGFEVGETEVIDGVLEVDVESTRTPACHHCNSVRVMGHGRRLRRIRDRACGYPVVLRWRQRRVKCHDCGATSSERHPELAGSRCITRRFRHLLFDQAIRRPFAHVAAAERVSLYRVLEAFDFHATAELFAHEPEPPRVIGIDESAFRRRRRYHTVVSDSERRAVLELFEGRDRISVMDGLMALPEQLSAGVQTVVMDPFWNYRRGAEAAFPNARIVADKFHIIRVITEAAHRVRKREGRRKIPDRPSKRTKHKRYEPDVYNIQWLFTKRAARLSSSERQRLQTVFESKPAIGVAWLMKETFAAIYDASDRAEAERRLDVWVSNLPAADLPEMTASWRQLASWREPILAYFDDPMTNAFAEGITNKIKVLKRSAYGFRNAYRYRQKVLLSCGRSRDGWPAHH